MAKKSKKFLAAQAQVPEEPIAPLAAMNLLKEISSANFDETVEAHFRLGIDTRQADQQLRGTVSLPNGSGKSVRVAVFAEGEAARVAEEAGADIVGTEELIAQVQAGEFNFDAAVATPDQMGKVGRLGKILGPRGLMPNPKLGTVTNDGAKAIKELKGGRVEYLADRYGIAHVTIGKISFTAEQLAENFGAVYDEIIRMKPSATVTNDVAKAIKELKGGRVEYRADRYGIAHVTIGKISFTAEQLAENYGAVYDEIIRMKPSAAKGKYVKSVNVASTMSPAVKVDSGVTRAYTEAAE